MGSDDRCVHGVPLSDDPECAFCELAALRAELEEERGLIDDIDSYVPQRYELYEGTDEVNEDAPIPLIERVQHLVTELASEREKREAAERERADGEDDRHWRKYWAGRAESAESQRDTATALLREVVFEGITKHHNIPKLIPSEKLREVLVEAQAFLTASDAQRARGGE